MWWGEGGRFQRKDGCTLCSHLDNSLGMLWIGCCNVICGCLCQAPLNPLPCPPPVIPPVEVNNGHPSGGPICPLVWNLLFTPLEYEHATAAESWVTFMTLFYELGSGWVGHRWKRGKSYPGSRVCSRRPAPALAGSACLA